MSHLIDKLEKKLQFQKKRNKDEEKGYANDRKIMKEAKKKGMKKAMDKHGSIKGKAYKTYEGNSKDWHN